MFVEFSLFRLLSVMIECPILSVTANFKEDKSAIHYNQNCSGRSFSTYYTVVNKAK